MYENTNFEFFHTRAVILCVHGWYFLQTERGTTGAGELQITGVPRVQQPLKLDGHGTTGSDTLLGRTSIRQNGIRPLTSPAIIHGSMVTDGAK